MTVGTHSRLPDREPFVGRVEELARAERAVDRVIAGEGVLLLISGEAGLGKTRIANAITRLAADRGARVAWGRAWEAGGAPAFWPWIQVLRALGFAGEPFAPGPSARDIDLATARFAAFDRVARWLANESRERPLVIVLDDLHAADISTLVFLHFVARDLVGSRILLLGTYRDVEARLLAEIGPLLAKIAREGDVIQLARLSPDDVLAWVCAASGRSDDAARDDALRIYRASEGNALFVHELLRTGGRTSESLAPDAITPADASVAFGLRAVLDDHLSRVSSDTRAVLEIASVLGRDLDPILLVAISGLPRDPVEAALREARDAGILASIVGGERLSFAHILLRERLYAALVPSRRMALHAAVGEHLAAGGGDPATAAHHLLAGSSAPVRIAQIALVAARASIERFAFEDAATLCQGALARHSCDDDVTIDLETTLGEAQMRAGSADVGRSACHRAAERAKRIGSAIRYAESALAYATELMTGTLDTTMVALLRDALEQLPDQDSPLRVRVLARYAAALVPPRSVEEAGEVLARAYAAIAMARRTGDDDTLLFALHYGGSALGYLVSAHERAEITRELFVLAQTLGRPLAMLNVGGWYVSTLREHASPAQADAALVVYEGLVRDFPQPHYRWRVPMLRATFAMIEGEFELAERLSAAAFAIAEQGEIRAGAIAWALHRLALAHLRGEPRSIAPHADRMAALLGRMSGAKGFLAWIHAACGRPDEARTLLAELAEVAENFPWCLVSAEAVCFLGDVALAERFYPALCRHARENSLFWGPFGSVVIGPTQRIAGDVARLLGRIDEAQRWYREAVALGERMRAPVFVTLAARGLAALELPPDRAPAGSRAAAIDDITLVPDGELWRITSSTGVAFHLKDSKGLHYVAQLLSRPGQEIHVTQLAALGELAGDGAAVLDDRAKREYKARIETLRAELDEAESFGDAARAERLQVELDAIANQLARAVGIGRRDRKLGSQVERVRINVQRRIRDAVERIAACDPALGRYLAATLKTGNFCAFSAI